MVRLIPCRVAVRDHITIGIMDGDGLLGGGSSDALSHRGGLDDRLGFLGLGSWRGGLTRQGADLELWLVLFEDGDFVVLVELDGGILAGYSFEDWWVPCVLARVISYVWIDAEVPRLFLFRSGTMMSTHPPARLFFGRPDGGIVNSRSAGPLICIIKSVMGGEQGAYSSCRRGARS